MNMTEIAGQFQNLLEMTERPTLFVKTGAFGRKLNDINGFSDF